ncbi:MAG TPA: hypothetical protein PK710_11795, partial [Polyangiaceae bacterium]|nr:hypothetical protein [Polyangiaceae bacterium]
LFSMPNRLVATFSLFGILALLPNCQLFVQSDLDKVYCEQEGVIGPPACPSGASCQRGQCVMCSNAETCGDGIDNNCNGLRDEGCEDAGSGDGDAPWDADDAPATQDVFEPPEPNLDGRVTTGLQVLYAFMEGQGTTVKDYAPNLDPIDLKIESFDHVKWKPGGGLHIAGATRIAASNTQRLIDACRKQNAITVEAWIEPEPNEPQSFAPFASLSFSSSLCNFTLAQQNHQFAFRLRTTNSDNQGMPTLLSETNAVTDTLTHLVVVRNQSGLVRFVVDGVEKGKQQRNGSFSNWGSNAMLTVGNAFSEDPTWLGTLYLIAVYCHPLMDSDIAKNYAVGKPTARQ